MDSTVFICIIAALATAGVIIRPFRLPEAVWAVSGALFMLLFGLISWSDAWTGVLKGTDVYLFLIGMMMLAEAARQEGLFDWLACHATKVSGGSAIKLFILIYIVGLIVTTFMSNDATAVVLTPAVAAAMNSAKVKQPLPYLLICAFIANAASFILPISNPANLVIYGRHMPTLATWLSTYLLPSFFAVTITFLMLLMTQRKYLREPIATDISIQPLQKGGRIAMAGIILTSIILIIASALNWELGLPTAIAGVGTALIVAIGAGQNPLRLVRHISWAVLPLVAGLFVVVEALNSTGLISALSHILADHARTSPDTTAWVSGSALAFGSNLVNNLPAGLIAGSTASAGHLPAIVRSCILIGVDLGPNLSVTGSLATILWLTELRRHGHSISAWQFLKTGSLVMIPALIAAFAALWI
ncbi:arsenic transporter [uncultured Chryseobacterium sp.]|uniref:arsenic transporter n=1 Tax=uncultured Chryseobacterium sp. TaxID=259322 RepID=UPI0025D91021|nr:arsenic transporter [uncultured Chryseobacterium sp.]